MFKLKEPTNVSDIKHRIDQYYMRTRGVIKPYRLIGLPRDNNNGNDDDTIVPLGTHICVFNIIMDNDM